MRTLKRLAASVLTAVLCLTMLGGCAEKVQGGTLEVSVGGYVTTLDPIYAEDVCSQTALVHLYENLMKVVSDGAGGTKVVMGMAKSVDVEENFDGTVTYTFRLRGSRWSDGEAVVASDFVYAWRRLAHPESYSPYAELLSVVCGYAEARESGDMNLLQVSAKNESTLVVTLDGHYDWFLREVCTSHATVPLRGDVVQKLKDAGLEGEETGGEVRAWWSTPTALVTNGAYVVSEYKGGTSLQLTASERYYEDLMGPATLTLHFADAAGAQELYDQNMVDAIWPLTEERLAQLAEDETWTPIPQLSSYAVVYNGNHDLLGDVQIREAMSLVIDRNALAEIAGVTAVESEGLVPFGVPENEEGDFRTIGGALLDNDPETYAARCEEARELLSNAGYNRGEELGELEYLYLEEETNGAVAQALCRQWQEQLGVQVTPRGMSSKLELMATLRSGEYAVAGLELEAPGNDAECFLMDWTSESQNNVAAYENSAYDTLMSIIAAAADGTARMGCLHDAEALLLGDFALSPLYSKGTDWMLRENLTGAVRDTRGWFNFSNVITRTN